MRLTEEQTNKFITSGKQYGLTGKEVIDGLIKRGYDIEGVDVEAVKKTFTTPQAPVETTPEPSILDTIKKSFQGSEIFSSGGSGGVTLAPKVEGESAMDRAKKSSEIPENKKIVDMALGFGGASGAIKDKVVSGGKELLSPITKSISETGDAISNKIGSTIDDVSKVKTPLQKTIEAISEAPKGKAGIKAYEEIATKGRDVTNKGIFTSQKLGASTREVEVGTRLNESGVTFGKNNIENLKNIGVNLKKTEEDITKLLKGDPEMVFNLQKDILSSKMESLKVDNLGDFVGDNQKIYNNVINFGKKILAKTEDTILGGRSGRIQLDNGLRAKFPSAYKSGFLDTSTPSGAAIKALRDAWNTHLYEVAPNGSEIQKLIQREADLFFANHNIAKKALEQDGVKLVGDIIENFPILKGFGLGALTGSKSSIIYGFK